MLEKIDDYKKKLDMFRPLGEELLPEIKAYYRVGLAYSSTALEGFSYTESETKILLEEGLTVGGKPLRDARLAGGRPRKWNCWSIQEKTNFCHRNSFCISQGGYCSCLDGSI